MALVYRNPQASQLTRHNTIHHIRAGNLNAQRRGIRIMCRAELLAEMLRLRQGIAVAGAHKLELNCQIPDNEFRWSYTPLLSHAKQMLRTG